MPNHQRTQSLLLISKLLDCREGVSPFTLVIDTIEQSARPLLKNYISRAKSTKATVTFVSFETLRFPRGVDNFISARNLDANVLQKKIISAVSSSLQSKNLLLIDTLHHLITDTSISLSAYLSSLIGPSTSLVAVYHADQPLSSLASHASISYHCSPYQPPPFKLLRFLATTILTVHSFSHILVTKAARDRSSAAPLFGLLEDEEGTIQGLGANDGRGVVVECEMRRKSGRTVELWFVLDTRDFSSSKGPAPKIKKRPLSPSIVLLEEHPLYFRPREDSQIIVEAQDQSIRELSFNLGLTEKQKRDREGVVLPYYDAQSEGAPGEGGRILYDMGWEDDFDEEEDEI